MSIEQVQRWYWNLRGNLATSLLLIAVVGALASWWVAARALRPIARDRRAGARAGLRCRTAAAAHGIG